MTDKVFVLFVGEGDFSFCLNYIMKSKSSNEVIIGSCLSNNILTARQQKNIQCIEQKGGLVLTDVDATCLEYHPQLKDIQFSKIIFNFPHIPGKMNIRKNRQLVEQFFFSSKKILKNCGTIIVTLCKGQGGTDIEKTKRKWCDTWQIVSLAAPACLILYRVQPFNVKELEIYQCTGFRGLEKPFNTEGALTHVFKPGDPVSINIKNKDYLDVNLYLKILEELYRNIYSNTSQPCFKFSSSLHDIIVKIFPSFHKETIHELLTCKEFSSFDETGINVDFCLDCTKKLLHQFLNKKKLEIVTGIESIICCYRNINKFPFNHFYSLFSEDSECLLKHLPTIMKHLQKIYNTNISNELEHQNDSFEDNDTVHSTTQFIDENVSVENVLDLYATCSVIQGDEQFFYSKINLLGSRDNALIPCDNVFKIGTIIQINYDFKKCICILFNVTVLASLKYHVLDFRIFLSENSFYTSAILNGCQAIVYRPLSLYPATYVHDISFYTYEKFHENKLFLIVRNAVGSIIKSITLVDSYYDERVLRHSRCYRFIYQSYNRILSKDTANEIHTKFVRKLLANSLNISLR